MPCIHGFTSARELATGGPSFTTDNLISTQGGVPAGSQPQANNAARLQGTFLQERATRERPATPSSCEAGNPGSDGASDDQMDASQQMVVEEDGTTRLLTAKERRRLRRRVTNRNSALRMRAKRQEEIDAMQGQVSSLKNENDQLKQYVGRLETAHMSMSNDITMWQARCRTSAASNMQLRQQLMQLTSERAWAAQHSMAGCLPMGVPCMDASASSDSELLRPLGRGPSSLGSMTSNMTGIPTTPDAPWLEHLPAKLSAGHAQRLLASNNFQRLHGHPSAVPYPEELCKALSSIFEARDYDQDLADVAYPEMDMGSLPTSAMTRG